MTLEFDESALVALESEIIQRGNEALNQMVALAIGLAPERSGELRGGIRVLKYFSPGDLSGEIGVVGVRHAPFVHFGTRYNRARPFLIQAYDRIAPAFVASLSGPGGARAGLRRGIPQYAFAPGIRQYTYLQPGQTPPDNRFNYINVQGGGTTIPD